jgi:hypothetical protein
MMISLLSLTGGGHIYIFDWRPAGERLARNDVGKDGC